MHKHIRNVTYFRSVEEPDPGSGAFLTPRSEIWDG